MEVGTVVVGTVDSYMSFSSRQIGIQSEVVDMLVINTEVNCSESGGIAPFA